MATTGQCARCGAGLTDSARDRCPKCLLELGFLRPTCGDDNAVSLASDEAGSLSPQETPGRIGPYKILEVLGEGGMGIVYLAQQDKPIRRRVALKLIKLGMDTRQVIARFESERQALALMDHVNIAKVHDAGVSEQGRPYFVMEYAKGIPITMHCDKHRLTIPQRLRLFMQVCEGVQHAHRQGIVHRDIKPSNILIVTQGAEDVPKIIDFGLAKATAQRLTEKTVYTQLGQVIGTPEYMSPEQANPTPREVDGRTDVYSLGVVLYECLVGARPFDVHQLRDQFHEVRRMIREDDPPKPSTRVARLGDAAEVAARNRGTDAVALSKLLRGDLDCITMMAMEKSPSRRYGSPFELAADIGRHLSDRPVLASPPSVAYGLGKFLKRHKSGVIAGTAAAVVLSSALVGTWWLWPADTGLRDQLELVQHWEKKVYDETKSIRELLTAAVDRVPGEDRQRLIAVLDEDRVSATTAGAHADPEWMTARMDALQTRLSQLEQIKAELQALAQKRLAEEANPEVPVDHDSGASRKPSPPGGGELVLSPAERDEPLSLPSAPRVSPPSLRDARRVAEVTPVPVPVVLLESGPAESGPTEVERDRVENATTDDDDETNGGAHDVETETVIPHVPVETAPAGDPSERSREPVESIRQRQAEVAPPPPTEERPDWSARLRQFRSGGAHSSTSWPSSSAWPSRTSERQPIRRSGAPAAMMSEEELAERVALTIGPSGGDQTCNNCHANEIETWRNTRHYATFSERHRTEEAKAIQGAMGVRSMKRDDVCVQCHYTRILQDGRERTNWGVSCESCHGPAKEWNNLHNKVGGDPGGQSLVWGTGKKNEDPALLKKRFDAAAAKGMIHSEMIYGIATNCFGCHTVPNEELVNKGKHKAGSDFDLVAWSQGEVRHNYVSSPGAPENPTNRELSTEEKRDRYVVGAMVDLEVSLRNLASVKEKGGDFHKAMVDRVNRARKKVDAILAKVKIPALASAVGKVPSPVDASTVVKEDLADALGQATREFATKDMDLVALDDLIPTEFKGKARS